MLRCWERKRRMFRFDKKKVLICFLAVLGMGFFLSFLILCDLGTDPATFMNRSGAARVGLSFGTWQLIVNDYRKKQPLKGHQRLLSGTNNL